MLTEGEVRKFIESVLPIEDDHLKKVRLRADELGLPHNEMFPSQTVVIKALALAIGARHVLELGTFLGYSAIALAQAMDVLGGGCVTTVDMDAVALREARRNISSIALTSRIDPIEADAEAACRSFIAQGRLFDLVLLDVAETEYVRLYPLCVELLRSRGVLVVDNILMATVEGWASGANVVQGVGSGVLGELRSLIDLLAGDPCVCASLISMGSGLAICTKF